jgi:hypothetical protein
VIVVKVIIEKYHELNAVINPMIPFHQSIIHFTAALRRSNPISIKMTEKLAVKGDKLSDLISKSNSDNGKGMLGMDLNRFIM